MKQLSKIEISGCLEGIIWMPAVICEKEFSVTFTPDDRPFTREWTGLENAIDYITNDGDFQYCKIQYAWMDIIWIDGNKRISQCSEITPGKLLKDYFVS